MKLDTAKLVTIIADEALEQQVLADLRSVMVKGFTRSEATGEGLNQSHPSGWEGKNIRLETLVSASKADEILSLCAEKYLDKFGMIIFVSDVQVVRPGRFT